MIEVLKYCSERGFYRFKINADADIVEFVARHNRPDIPVVTMHVFARSFVTVKMVGGGEAGLCGDFEHTQSSFPVKNTLLQPVSRFWSTRF
jgi:hypothetical protein